MPGHHNPGVSTVATRPQTAGWYPDPGGGLGVRWWDGQEWTGWRSMASSAAELPPLGPRFARLGDLVAQLLLANTALSLLMLAVERFVHHGVVLLVLAGAALGLLLVTGVAWCAWQWRMAVSAPGHLRRPPGGHIRAWFTPVANLWLPLENINDLWYAYEPVDDYGWGRDVFIVPWWACLVASAALAVMEWGALLQGDVHATLAVAWALAALLAWFVVRRLSWRALLYHSHLE